MEITRGDAQDYQNVEIARTALRYFLDAAPDLGDTRESTLCYALALELGAILRLAPLDMRDLMVAHYCDLVKAQALS
jgi:hypothetical protein